MQITATEAFASVYITPEQLHTLIQTFFRENEQAGPINILSDQGFSEFVARWTAAHFPNEDGSTCETLREALQARAHALVKVSLDIAYFQSRQAIEPRQIDVSGLWSHPTFVLAALSTPLRYFTNSREPLFDFKEFFSVVSLIEHSMSLIPRGL
ncbi:hypothetical protein C4J81_03250 [Deltaproteobacteria bacterium Smac51]|nr:hypothetical protein C4J81_03250 [Deltaproteobacteria bacterium Smac51]